MGDDLRSRAALAAGAAAAAADDVDRAGRFPREAIDEMRRQRLLGMLVPVDLGGEGASIADVAACCETLGGACASSAMVFAMHQIQVACLVHHGGTPALQLLLKSCGGQQLLFASATSEIGVGGDGRSSVCAVDAGSGSSTLTKQAPVISYGDEADHIFITARREPSSPSSDQVLIACPSADIVLERTSTWNSLGFRGTASHGYRLEATFEPDMIFAEPFGGITSQTMFPVSHVLWSRVWLGLATEAAKRAQASVRRRARKAQLGELTTARLAELSLLVSQFRSHVASGLALYEGAAGDPDTLESMTFAVAINNLKLTSSSKAVEVVSKALAICGIEGYQEGTPTSVSRHLRDAYGAGVMVNSDRILAANAHLLLASRNL